MAVVETGSVPPANESRWDGRKTRQRFQNKCFGEQSKYTKCDIVPVPRCTATPTHPTGSLSCTGTRPVPHPLPRDEAIYGRRETAGVLHGHPLHVVFVAIVISSSGNTRCHIYFCTARLLRIRGRRHLCSLFDIAGQTTTSRWPCIREHSTVAAQRSAAQCKGEERARGERPNTVNCAAFCFYWLLFVFKTLKPLPAFLHFVPVHTPIVHVISYWALTYVAYHSAPRSRPSQKTASR